MHGCNVYRKADGASVNNAIECISSMFSLMFACIICIQPDDCNQHDSIIAMMYACELIRILDCEYDSIRNIISMLNSSSDY